MDSWQGWVTLGLVKETRAVMLEPLVKAGDPPSPRLRRASSRPPLLALANRPELAKLEQDSPEHPDLLALLE
jgi:hypothetical protein